MDKRIIISFYMLFLFSCDDITCRFNKVPEAPYPDPDRVEEFKTNIINQITYVYECLDNEKYPKQFVAITYTIEKLMIQITIIIIHLAGLNQFM